MQIDELHKFSDGTLNDVRTSLDDRLKGIRMKYLPQASWRKSDKERAAAMIQAIDKQLKTRRIMRSLKKFVGKDCAKIIKKQSKPSNIEHEIKRLHQKPDQRTFSAKVKSSQAKRQRNTSTRTYLAISSKFYLKEKVEIKRSNRRRVPNIVEPEIRTIKEIIPMDDRTMEELLQAPTEGFGEAIVIPKILAENFEIKTNLLQLVQANKFHSFERDNPHTHISNFKRMAATLKYKDVPNDAVKLMLFPYSLEGAARIRYEKEPPNSILTWDDLVNKFVNQFFPPSKTTHLKNEISRFTQRFEETFGEAWDCWE
nr:reverse transcriptase domain-containing protein [Tanacetum cinerariifolium]